MNLRTLFYTFASRSLCPAFVWSQINEANSNKERTSEVYRNLRASGSRKSEQFLIIMPKTAKDLFLIADT